MVGSYCCTQNFELSPDGSLASFFVRTQSPSAQLFVVPVDRGAAPVQLASTVFGRALSFTPDASRLVYVEASGLYDVFVDGSQAPVQLAARVQGSQPYRISPDGQRVVYRADNDVVGRIDLYARPLDASAPAVRLTQPFTSGSVEDELVQFTPDSSRIVYRADHAAPDLRELYSSPLP